METVLVFVLGWFLADPEIMKLYRSVSIPMGWDYENVVVVPVDVLADYDPDYRPEAMSQDRMTEDFRRIGEVLSSVSGVEYTAPCRPFFPGINNSMSGRVFRDSTHFMECSMLYRVSGTDFMEVFGYEWVQPESSPFLTEDAVGRVVVSEDLAEFLFPGENPIGKSFESTESGNNVIVGVIPRQKLREITGIPTPVVIANIAAVNYSELSTGGAYWVLRTAAAWPLENRLQASADVSFRNIGLIYLALNLVLGAFSFWLLSSRKSQDEYGVRQAMGATPARLRLSAVARAARSTGHSGGYRDSRGVQYESDSETGCSHCRRDVFQCLSGGRDPGSVARSDLWIPVSAGSDLGRGSSSVYDEYPGGSCLRVEGLGDAAVGGPSGGMTDEEPSFHIAPLFRPLRPLRFPVPCGTSALAPPPLPQRQQIPHFPAVAEVPEPAGPCDRALPGPPRPSAPCHNGSKSCIFLPLRKYGVSILSLYILGIWQYAENE